MDGPLAVFGGGYTAFAQFADLDRFEAKIVVIPQVPLSPAGKFVNAVHEIGHVLDLRHNPHPRSVMYPDIENMSKMREFKNAVQYRMSHILNLRHMCSTPSRSCALSLRVCLRRGWTKTTLRRSAETA